LEGALILSIILAILTPFTFAAKEGEGVGQTTYWDRLMGAQAEKDMMFGIRFLNQKDYDAALKHFANAVVKSPNDPKAHQFLGVAYYWSGKVDRAETEFLESLRLDDKDAQTHLLLGIVHAWKGDVKGAFKAFERAAKLDPKRADIQMNMGSVEETLGRYSDSLKHFRRAVELDKRHPLYRYQLGMLYRRLGREEDAVSELREAIKIFPRYQDAILELGALYERMDELKDALAMFDKSVKLKNRDAVARFRYARTAILLGREDLARKALRGVFHLTPSDRGAGLALSVSYGGKAPGAEGEKNGSPEGEGEEPKSRPKGPLDVLKRNLSRIPLEQEAVLQVDMAFLPKPKLVKRRVGETPSSLKRALERAGKLPKKTSLGAQKEFTLPAGDAAERRAKISDIIDDLQKTLDTAPPESETRIGMNLKFSEKASGPGAPKDGKRPKVSYQPRDVGNDLGLWVMGTGWMELVTEAIESERTPKRESSLWNVVEGIGFSTLGQSDRAAESFERAIALDPKDALAHLGLGVAMVIRGDEDAAVAAYRRALEIDPASRNASEGLKWLLREDQTQ
jgi:tetratricopeptide (TPR) repeat protein